MTTLEELEQKVGQLRRNLEKLPRETLKKDYRKAYDKLLSEINMLGLRYIQEELANGDFLILKEDGELGEKVAEEIRDKIIAEKNKGGHIFKAISALIKRCDIEEFKAEVIYLYNDIMDIYGPYYQVHVGLFIPLNARPSDAKPIPYNNLSQKFFIDDEWKECPELIKKGGMFIEYGACCKLADQLDKKEEV